MSDAAAFGLADFETVAGFVVDAWSSGVDADWSVPAGTLEWSCLQTAEHTVDCVFSFAFFLASRKEDGYPNFGELHALPGATPADMVEGLKAAIEMLRAVIVAAPATAQATIWRNPSVRVATPSEFASRGALELLLHGFDVCAGLGLTLRPPHDLCGRLLTSTTDYPGCHPYVPSDDPWSDLLARSGRPRPTSEAGNRSLH